MISADNDDDDKHPLLMMIMMMLKKMLIMPVVMNDQRDNDPSSDLWFCKCASSPPQAPTHPPPSHTGSALYYTAYSTVPHTLLCRILYWAAPNSRDATQQGPNCAPRLLPDAT